MSASGPSSPLVVACNVHLNARMWTGYVDSIFKTQCRILMTSLKLTTMSFEYVAEF